MCLWLDRKRKLDKSRLMVTAVHMQTAGESIITQIQLLLIWIGKPETVRP